MRSPSLIISILALILLTALCYQTYWGNVWYVQDDYYTVDLGGANPTCAAAGKIISTLYEGQRRYQPVRLFLFCIAVHLFPEEYSFFYNFGLHLVNILLLFLLIRTFKVNDCLAFAAAAVFSAYGISRTLESPSTMIGGSGLSAFFTLVTLLLLAYGLGRPSGYKKYISLLFSYISYLCLVFSYEVAFPMIVVISYGFILLNRIIRNQGILSCMRSYLVLAPYVGALAVYYFLFRSQPSSYEGATMSLDKDVIIRLFSYSKAMISPFREFRFSLRLEIVIDLIIYYLGIYLLFRCPGAEEKLNISFDSPRNHLSVLLFGVAWYICSVVLFIFNRWQVPTNIMWHHLYLMTAGCAIAISSIFFCLSDIIYPKAKNIYKWSVMYVILPAFLINSLSFHLNYGEASAYKAETLRNVKRQIQSYVPDVSKIDALILKNFLKPENLYSYQISNMNGALLQWFYYKKYIKAGDDILSVKNGKIVFVGPLSHHPHLHHRETIVVQNNKAEILFFDSATKKLLPYEEEIDFEKGINIHQTKQVRNDLKLEEGYIEAILRNNQACRFLKVALKEPMNPSLIGNAMLIAVNDEPVKEAYISGNLIFIDISRFITDRFVFVDIGFAKEPAMVQKIKGIYFADSSQGDNLRLLKSASFDFGAYREKHNICPTIRYFDEDRAEFINWYDVESAHRWAKGQSGSIAVRLKDFDANMGQYKLNLEGFTLGNQQIEILMNNVSVAKMLSEGAVSWSIPLEASLLKPNSLNTIEFRIPGARSPGPKDERILGFALRQLSITLAGD